MTKALPYQDLLKLHQLMELMLVKAKNKEWDSLSSLDDERRNILRYEHSLPKARDLQLQRAGLPNAYTQHHTAVPIEKPTEFSKKAAMYDLAKHELQAQYNAKAPPIEISYEVLREAVLKLDVEINLLVTQARSRLIAENISIKEQAKVKQLYESAYNI